MMFERLAAHTFGLVWQHKAAEAVELVADSGFTATEVLALPPHLDVGPPAAQELDRLRLASERCGVAVTAMGLAANDFNLGSTDRAVAEFSLAKHIDLIKAASRAGAESVIVVPGRRHGLLPPPDTRQLELVREGLAKLHDLARPLGIRLLVESHPLSLVPTSSALKRLVIDMNLPGIAVAYDAANAFATGEDIRSSILELSGLIGTVHLSDAPHASWRHDPIGSGDIDFGAVRSALDDVGYRGTVVVEVVTPSAIEDMRRGRELLIADGWRFAA